MQHDPTAMREARLGVGEVEQRRGDPAPARVLADGQPAELGGAADHHDPAGAEQLAVLDRDQVDALVIAAVELVVLGHPLLDAEHRVAQLQGRGELVLVARPPDLVEHRPGHLSAYLRMSFSNAAALSYGPAWSNTILPSRS